MDSKTTSFLRFALIFLRARPRPSVPGQKPTEHETSDSAPGSSVHQAITESELLDLLRIIERVRHELIDRALTLRLVRRRQASLVDQHRDVVSAEKP
jgi:hypothetical protein